MIRTIKVQNPDYKTIQVGYRIKMAPVPGMGVLEGHVDLFLRAPEAEGRRRIRLRCAAGPERLWVIGMGKASEWRLERKGDMTRRDVSVVVRELPQEALLFLLAVRASIEREWKRHGPIDVSKPVERAGVITSYPHERGVKWLRQYEQVPFESLPEEPIVEAAFP